MAPSCKAAPISVEVSDLIIDIEVSDVFLQPSA